MNHSVKLIVASMLALLFATPSLSQTIEFTVEAPGVQSSQVSGITTETFDGVTQTNMRTSGYALPSGIGTVAANNTITINAANNTGGAGGVGQFAFTNQSTLDINLSEPRRYLGFWWSTGASGATDRVEIYGSVNGDGPEVLLGTFNPTSVIGSLIATTNCPGNLPNGHYGNPNANFQCQQAPNIFAYINVNLSDPTYFFTRIMFGGDFLEFDNLSVSGAYVGTHTIGGSVSGLASGQSVVLQNNAGDDLTVSTDGNFTFATEINSGTDYAVTVLTQPTGQTCTVTNGSGTNITADVTTVAVSCVDLGLGLSAGSIDFGELAIGAGGSRTITIENTGAGDVDLTGLTGPSAPFAVDSGTCLPLPTTLAVGESCTVTMTFNPTEAGSFSNTMLIANTAGSDLTVGISASSRVAVIPTLSFPGLVLMVLLMGGIAVMTQRAMASPVR